MDVFPFEPLHEEHRRIAAEAETRGFTLRLLGALAFHLRCPNYVSLRRDLGRELSDLDHMVLSEHRQAIITLLTSLGHTLDERRAMLHGHESVLFFHPSGLRLDVFFDRLDMSHQIDLRNRLGVDPDTISLGDLLLEKMQIVRITAKDAIDKIILVLEHPVTPTDAGINAQYIAQRLAGDWGFYYTVVNNLRRIRDKFLEQCPQLSAQERQQLRDRIDQLPDHMEAEPKTLKWKARARIGT